MAQGSNDGVQEVLRLRDELLSLAAQISAKYANQRFSEKKVVSLLMEYTCERRILEELKLGVRCGDEIDKAWRNLHSYAVALLTERLKNRLSEAGFHVGIVNEAESPTGFYDILLRINSTGLEIINGDKSICLEAKTGFSISLSQLEKYLWNGVTIILVRFTTSDVIAFRPGDWATLLKAVLIDRIEKARRIIAGKAIIVQSVDCKQCPLESCRFYNGSPQEGDRLRKNNSIIKAFEGFKRNAVAAIEAAINAVLEELNRATAQMHEAGDHMLPPSLQP
jgi:hypothetical protein